MGLISAALASASSVLSDSWRDYFYCDSLSTDVLVARGHKREKKELFKKSSDSNVISNGSIVCVADGQCMLIVDQGKIVDVCAEAGEFLYDTSTQPSLFYGSLGENIKATFEELGKRIGFGGVTAAEQRVYYVNIKELIGNKYGTVTPVPFRVVDQNIGLDVDISIRCHGEYSYRISDPLLFYVNVCGNVSETYRRDQIDSQLKSEVLTAMQPAFARISEMGIRYSALPGRTTELSEAMNAELSEKWGKIRGLEIVSFGVSSVTASKEDEDMIKEMQKTGAFRNPNMAAAYMVNAQGEAMKAAANNANGAMMGFAGLNMAASAGGVDTNALFQAGASQPQQQPVQQNVQPQQAEGWTCSCGATGNTGNFCGQCGAAKPVAMKPAGSWTCSCGQVNEGNFCSACGSKKPESTTWTCSCGQVNEGNFCPVCGNKKPE